MLLTAVQARAQAAPDSARPKPTRQRTAYEDMQMFSQVLNQIRVNHPDSIDMHELMMAAVDGMVHAADPAFVRDALHPALGGEGEGDAGWEARPRPDQLLVHRRSARW